MENSKRCRRVADPSPARRSLLLHEARRELVGVLQQLDPSSTPVAESPSTSTGVPSTTPPAMPPLIAPPAPLPAFGDPSPSTSIIPLPPPPLPTFGAPSLSSSLNTFSPISSASNLPLFPAPVTSAYQVPSPDIVLRTDALDGIDNPLAVLAHVSLHDRGNADDFTYAMKEESELISKAERFYSTGLYTAIDDSEGQLDPVTMGMLTDRDLRRLVNL